MSRHYTLSLGCFALSMTLSAVTGCGKNPCDLTSPSFSPTECGGLMLTPVPMPEPMPEPMPMPMTAKATGTVVIGGTGTGGLKLLSLENPSQKTALTSPPSGSGDGMPAFSLDGSQVVFVRGVDTDLSKQSLRIINTDGTGETELATCVTPTDGAGICENPVIANDGNVYYIDRYLALDGAQSRILKYVPKTGGTPTEVRNDLGSCAVRNFVHNRAGSKLLLNIGGGNCGGGKAGIYSFAPGTATGTPINPLNLRDDLSSYSPALFSQAGDKVLFPGVDALPNNVYVDRIFAMNEDGTSFAPQFDLPNGIGVATNTRMTSDGKFLLVESGLEIVSIATTSPSTVTKVPGIESVASFDVKP